MVDSFEWLDLLLKHRITLPDPQERGITTEYKPLNVFFVRKYKGRALAETDRSGNCAFEDHRDTTTAGETLAHEAVHHLLTLAGIPSDVVEHHVKSDRSNLMFPSNPRPGGTRLTRDQIERINFSDPFHPRRTYTAWPLGSQIHP